MDEKKQLKTLAQVTIHLTPTYPELTYKRRSTKQKFSIGWGQRKLLLSEIQFLTEYYNPLMKCPLLVYVGAAQGNHLPILHLLFSNFVFHLYDPRPFHLCSTDHILVYNRLFTDQDAQYWRQISLEHHNVFFISDIRTAELDNNYKDAQTYEKQIWNDMLQQEKWVYLIQPFESLLKFRLPYGKGHRQEDQEDSKHVTYLNGTLFTQPYAKSTSSETRLVPNHPLSSKTYNVFQYENQMFRFNTIDREQSLFLNPMSQQVDPLNEPELLNDHDSAYEYIILERYLKKVARYAPSEKIDMHCKVQQFSRLITEALSSNKTLSKLRSYLSYTYKGKSVSA